MIDDLEELSNQGYRSYRCANADKQLKAYQVLWLIQVFWDPSVQITVPSVHDDTHDNGAKSWWAKAQPP